MGFYGNELILEYKGNDYKNKEFTNSLNNIRKYYNDYLNYIIELFNIIDKALKYVQSINTIDQIKNTTQIKSITKDYNKIFHSFDTSYSKQELIYKDFLKLRRSFNNKYSNIGLDERKKLKLDIDTIKEKINSLLIKYNSKEFIDKLNSIANNYYNLVNSIPEDELSEDYHDDIYFTVDSMLSDFDSICKVCLNRLDLLIKYLKIDKIENSLGYKILN